MLRPLLLTLFAALSVTMDAQTMVRFSDVTITEKDRVVQGKEVVAAIPNATGSDRVVLHDQDGLLLTSWVKVTTKNVKRSSVKSSAVNATFELELHVAGKKDGRRVEKIFYADQERKATITEKFTFKNDLDVRVITVSYVATIE